MQRAPIAALTAALLTSAALAAPAPDRIYLSDGSILQDVDIQDETLTVVTYKEAKGKSEKQVDSEQVLRVDFSDKPAEIAEADIEAEAENFPSAASGMQNYLANLGSKGDRKNRWAPAYAYYRVVEFTRLGGDLPAMVGAVDELMASAPDSRYVPLALVQKIEAQILSNDMESAKATTQVFGDLVRDKQLPLRWQYEHQVRDLLTKGSLKGEKLEKELGALSRSAAAFPTVENRADVAIAESMVQRSEFAKAEELFRSVADDPNAFDSTLAAAWTGLGDSVYRRADAKSRSGDDDDAKALYSEAKIYFMRVVVNFRYEYAYVAKSAFYAGRCFQEVGGPDSRDRSNQLYRYVIRNFASSRWATDARDFQRQNR